MDILPIQASSVPSERVFSSASAIQMTRCSQIEPKLLEAIQMLKFSVRNGLHLDFMKGTDWDEEVKDLENLTNVDKDVTEDMVSWMCSLNV